MQSVADGDELSLSILAELGGLALSELKRGAVCKMPTGQYRIAGQLIEKRWITRRRLRFCPECVADDISADRSGGAAQRCSWHVPSVRTCIHHQVKLYDDDSYSHSRGPHDFAGRIRDFGLGKSQLKELAVPQASSSLEDYLTRRLAGEGQDVWLDNIEFGAIAIGAEVFGTVDLFGIEARPKLLSDAAKRRAGARGFEILSNGEVGVLHLLERLHVDAGAPIALLRKNFGCLYYWLQQSQAAQYEPLQDLVRKFFVDTYPFGEGEDVLGKACAGRRTHSVKTIRRALGLGHRQTVEILCANGFLKLDEQTGKPLTNVALDAKSVSTLVRSFSGAICQVAAQKKINAPRAQFGALVEGGVIAPVAGSPVGRPYYDEKQLDAFLDSIVPRTLAQRTDDLAGIQTVCRKAVAGAVDVVRLIQNGTLSTVLKHPEQEGYLSVLLDPIEVSKALRLMKPNGYLRSTLAGFLGVNAATVRYLVDEGYLELARARHPTSRKSIQMVPYRSVDQFLERYIPGKHCAEFLGRKTRKISDQLTKERVPSIQMGDGCRGRIFLRQSVRCGDDERKFRFPIDHVGFAWPDP